jgi:hypothetical protein
MLLPPATNYSGWLGMLLSLHNLPQRNTVYPSPNRVRVVTGLCYSNGCEPLIFSKNASRALVRGLKFISSSLI